MFLYLANATLRIPDDLKNRVFQDMAYKLMEWDDVKRDEIRKVLRQFDIKLDEICEDCNEPLPEHDDQGDARCDKCLTQRHHESPC
jgi:hypothetical protein